MRITTETGVVMIVYLDEVYDRRLAQGSMTTPRDLYDAIIEGAVMRVRPKMMTVTAIIAGLLPIMWSHGTGADVPFDCSPLSLKSRGLPDPFVL